MPQILQKTTATADQLRPFRAHGVELVEVGAQATGDCPLCGKQGKLAVQVVTGLWRCFVCGAEGNPLTFVRQLWERSASVVDGGWAKKLADDRGYLDQSTLTSWGVCRSAVDGTWLVPGFSTDGRLDQLYRRVQTRDESKGAWRWNLLPTPGLWEDGKANALFMPFLDYDPARQQLWVCEGPWDGMALWEVARQSKWGDGGALEYTGNPDASVLADVSVVARPGCQAWREEWTEMCRGKDVTIFDDNDHPRQRDGEVVTMAGTDGARRVAKLLAGVAASVKWLCWGTGGYDPVLASGFDVRDWLTKGV